MVSLSTSLHCNIMSLMDVWILLFFCRMLSKASAHTTDSNLYIFVVVLSLTFSVQTTQAFNQGIHHQSLHKVMVSPSTSLHCNIMSLMDVWILLFFCVMLSKASAHTTDSNLYIFVVVLSGHIEKVQINKILILFNFLCNFVTSILNFVCIYWDM